MKQEPSVTFTRSDDAAFVAALCTPDRDQERLQYADSEDREAVFRTQVSKVQLKDELDTLHAHRTDDTDANLAPSVIVDAYQSLGRRPQVARVEPLTVDTEEPEARGEPLTVDPEEPVEDTAALLEVLEERANEE